MRNFFILTLTCTLLLLNLKIKVYLSSLACIIAQVPRFSYSFYFCTFLCGHSFQSHTQPFPKTQTIYAKILNSLNSLHLVSLVSFIRKFQHRTFLYHRLTSVRFVHPSGSDVSIIIRYFQTHSPIHYFGPQIQTSHKATQMQNQLSLYFF